MCKLSLQDWNISLASISVSELFYSPCHAWRYPVLQTRGSFSVNCIKVHLKHFRLCAIFWQDITWYNFWPLQRVAVRCKKGEPGGRVVRIKTAWTEMPLAIEHDLTLDQSDLYCPSFLCSIPICIVFISSVTIWIKTKCQKRKNEGREVH